MRVRVDPARCRGHAQCALIAEDVFAITADDRAVVRTEVVPPESEGAVEEAVLMCPEAAIETEAG